MTSFEREDISKIPNQYRPMGAWGYFGCSVLFGIPILGLIILIVFACDGSNVCRRSYARSFFCGIIVMVLVLVVILVLILAIRRLSLSMFAKLLKEFLSNLKSAPL